MKNIFRISFLAVALMLSFVMIGCNTEEPEYYEGDSLVHFNQGEASTAYVNLNTGSGESDIWYGVTKEVTGSHNVDLVFDQSKSTAVLGTDFTITKLTDELVSGETTGNFKINVTEAAATAGKKAVFTLKSNTLSNAVFNKEMEVTFKLACPLNNFPLNYIVDVYVAAWSEFAPSHEQTLIPVAGTDNQFDVVSSWGPSFVAFATGNAAYNNQYLYKGRITINCTDVVFTSGETWGTGGTGTYDPNTGIIEFTVGQTLFTGSPFTTKCTFIPL